MKAVWTKSLFPELFAEFRRNVVFWIFTVSDLICFCCYFVTPTVHDLRNGSLYRNPPRDKLGFHWPSELAQSLLTCVCGWNIDYPESCVSWFSSVPQGSCRRRPTNEAMAAFFRIDSNMFCGDHRTIWRCVGRAIYSVIKLTTRE